MPQPRVGNGSVGAQRSGGQVYGVPGAVPRAGGRTSATAPDAGRPAGAALRVRRTPRRSPPFGARLPCRSRAPAAAPRRAADEHVSRETPGRDEDDPPLAMEALRAVQILNPSGEITMPRPDHPRVLCVANQKGGVGKTTTHGEPRGGAGPARQPGARGRPRPAGQRLDRAERAAPRRRPGRLRLPDRQRAARPRSPRRSRAFRTSTACRPPSTSPAPRSSSSRWWPASRGSRGRSPRTRTSSTTSSSTARRRSACSRSTRSCAAQEVLIPIQCEYYALEGLNQLINNINLVRQHLNPTLDVSTILLTMYDRRTRLADAVEQDVRNHFGAKVLNAVIPRNVRVSEAPSYGQSVMTYDPGSRGRDELLRGRAGDRDAWGQHGRHGMKNRPRGGLGRGLGALIPHGAVREPSPPRSRRAVPGAAPAAAAGSRADQLSAQPLASAAAPPTTSRSSRRADDRAGAGARRAVRRAARSRRSCRTRSSRGTSSTRRRSRS